MKKLYKLLLLVGILSMAFTSCAKNDDKDNTKQEQKTEQKTEKNQKKNKKKRRKKLQIKKLTEKSSSIHNM